MQGLNGAPHDGLGQIELLVVFVEGHIARTEVITFDIVDVPYAYNAILGRGTLNKFGGVPHHNYLFLKVPGPQGLIFVNDDQDLARHIEYGHPAPLNGCHIHNVATKSSEDPPLSAYPRHHGPPKPRLEGEVKFIPACLDQPD